MKIIDCSCKSKVRQFDNSVMNEKVGRFNISVNNVVLVDDLKAIADLHQNILNFSLRKPSSLRFDIGFKILLTIFQEEI